MKYSEVTALSAAELRNKTKEAQAELFEARMKHSLGQLANPMALRQLRKDVARMKMASAASSETKGAAAKTAAPKAKAKVTGKSSPKKKAPAKRGRK